MSRIQQVFRQKKASVLNVYCTAGYPELHATRTVMQALQDNGADLIELGMPYSDPLADGPVIQQSSARAIAAGMTIDLLFEQLKGFRETIQVPVVLMGYMNPVMQYGFEKFCTMAADAGIDGLILPDLPDYLFEKEFGEIIRSAGLDFIFLITPETPPERVRKLDALSSGFLYAVSTSSTTGSGKSMKSPGEYLEGLKSLGLKNPVLVGFGISNRESFQEACSHAAGAIIGSAYIKALENSTDIDATTRQFLTSVLG